MNEITKQSESQKYPSQTLQKTFELERVRKSVKIRDNASIDDLKPNILYCCAVSGLKPENFPKEEAKAVLFDWIIRKYSDLEPEELKIAFELAYDRKLNLQENDLNCYQDFSVSFFSRIMSAYRVYRTSQIKKKMETEKKELPVQKIDDLVYLRSSLVDKYNKILNGTPYNFSKTDGYVLYNKLESIGVELCQADYKQKVWASVKSNTSWFEKSKNNLQPTKMQGVNETKSRIFKKWILDHVEFGTDMQEEINEYLGK